MDPELLAHFLAPPKLGFSPWKYLLYHYLNSVTLLCHNPNEDSTSTADKIRTPNLVSLNLSSQLLWKSYIPSASLFFSSHLSLPTDSKPYTLEESEVGNWIHRAKKSAATKAWAIFCNVSFSSPPTLNNIWLKCEWLTPAGISNRWNQLIMSPPCEQRWSC